jgi:hypothetical protein
MTNELECGCQWTGTGTMTNPLRLAYCDRHLRAYVDAVTRDHDKGRVTDS